MEEKKDVEELFIIKLKKALNYYRITQYKFAKEIGINDQTLSDYSIKKENLNGSQLYSIYLDILIR